MRLLLLTMLFLVAGPSVKSFAQDGFKEVNPDKLSQIISSNAGQNKVLLIYASWCPHCQIIFPELIKIERDFPGSVQAISMDSDMDRFEAFIDKFPDLPIEPFIWDREFHLGISLNELGINFLGYIPFIALIDKNGTVVKEGHVTADEIKSFLK